MLEAIKTIYTTEYRPEVIFCARQPMPRELEGVSVATEKGLESREPDGVSINSGFVRNSRGLIEGRERIRDARGPNSCTPCAMYFSPAYNMIRSSPSIHPLEFLTNPLLIETPSGSLLSRPFSVATLVF